MCSGFQKLWDKVTCHLDTITIKQIVNFCLIWYTMYGVLQCGHTAHVYHTAVYHTLSLHLLLDKNMYKDI